MLHPTGTRRWYDQKTELTQCVQLLEAFPTEIRVIVADGMAYMAEKEFEVHLLMSSLRSLGPEKILGLYKSKNKRRNMDEDLVLHKTMNYFFILSPENQIFLARLTAELVNYIFQYFESCKTYSRQPSVTNVQEITQFYVVHGPEKAQEHIREIQKRFQQQLRAASETKKPTILSTESGMQIRKGPKN